MKYLTLILTLSLTSCIEPCPDYQCQINRAAIIGVMLQNQQQYYQPQYQPQHVILSTCDSLSAIAHNC